MPALDPLIITGIVLLVGLGAAWTWRIFYRRRDINRRGASKGTAQNPPAVRRQNPPDL